MRSIKPLLAVALLTLLSLPGTALAARIFDSSPKTIVRVVAQLDTANLGYVVVSDLRSDGPCINNLLFISAPSTTSLNYTPPARNLFELILAAQIVGRQLTDFVYDYDSSTGLCTLLRAGIL